MPVGKFLINAVESVLSTDVPRNVETIQNLLPCAYSQSSIREALGILRDTSRAALKGKRGNYVALKPQNAEPSV